MPTIGSTAATLLPTGLALLQSPQLAVSVLIYRLVLQNLEAFLLTPLLLRKTVNLLPTVALMAQLSLGALLGLPGVLLALPLVVVLQVLMQRVVVQQVMDRWGLKPLVLEQPAHGLIRWTDLFQPAVLGRHLQFLPATTSSDSRCCSSFARIWTRNCSTRKPRSCSIPGGVATINDDAQRREQETLLASSAEEFGALIA